ncbi:MAG: sensor domain-containing diguanylate cyclase, partial [Lachnospiraceae bacterium]|nr:sensor domain-containing diguanylate cyclase [Lachnospiraceae bacterium]
MSEKTTDKNQISEIENSENSITAKSSIANPGEDAEHLLNRIFDITQGLYDEMSAHKGDSGTSHIRIYHLLADLGRALVNADRASFWKWDKRQHKLITTAAVGEDQIEIPEGAGLVGKALSDEHAIVTNDPYNNPYFNSAVDKETGYRTKSILVMPIVDCKGETIGCYQAINKLDDNGFDLEADCKRLSLAAFICGLTLESDLFLDDSRRDKLTDIKNRAGFYTDYANRYLPILEAEEDPVPVSIVMGDIDFFKKVNDTFGHNAGDAVLAHVAKILRTSVRSGDGAYRWGGEEFILVLPGANMQSAQVVAERIRSRIESAIIPFDGLELRVTMSFGCAVLE